MPEQTKIVRRFKTADLPSAERAIPIATERHEVIGTLVPIDHSNFREPSILDALTRWRNEHTDCFFTQFTATTERTKRWLGSILADDTRLLFLVVDASRKAVGNFGIRDITARSAELDNILRGEQPSHRRLIFYTMLSAIRWAQEALGVDEVYLHVFAHNARAVKLYTATGLAVITAYAADKRVVDGEVRHVIGEETPSRDSMPSILKMATDRQRFAKQHTASSIPLPASTTGLTTASFGAQSDAQVARIPVAGPWITDKEIAYVADAVRTAWYGNANVYQERFERSFAEYLGVRYAVSLPSCTSAIHLALAAYGIGPGDNVIVPDVTWIASAAPISYVGATPKFADVDPSTWCLDVDSLAQCVTPETKAVIPVDLYGALPDMAGIRDVARRHGLVVIEDAAEALGAEANGVKAGSLGDVGVFSFHGSKTLTTGEGGMLVTNDEDIYRRVLHLRDHGREPGDTMFRNTSVAFKYRMSSLQAALGLAQLERVEELIAKKREIFNWYREELADVEGISLNYEAPGTKNSYWMVTIVVDPSFGIKKEGLIGDLRASGIDCRPFFYPLSSLQAYAGLEEAHRAQRHNRVSYAISPYGVNLPCALNLTRDQVRYVCSLLRRLLADAIAAPTTDGEVKLP